VKQSAKSRLLLARHAQSVWNAEGRWQGWSDAPLSALGAEQAHMAGKALAAAGVQPALVASSDLVRASRTAQIIADELGYSGEMVLDADLREQDLGDWNGLTRDEIVRRWPSEFEARRQGNLGTVPGGETGRHFRERCRAALERLAARGATETIVVAHGGVVIAVECVLGTWVADAHHGNLSGWWLEARGSGAEADLVPLGRVDLLSEPVFVPSPATPETVTGTA